MILLTNWKAACFQDGVFSMQLTALPSRVSLLEKIIEPLNSTVKMSFLQEHRTNTEIFKIEFLWGR
jgi:hypothetical protein